MSNLYLCCSINFHWKRCQIHFWFAFIMFVRLRLFSLASFYFYRFLFVSFLMWIVGVCVSRCVCVRVSSDLCVCVCMCGGVNYAEFISVVCVCTLSSLTVNSITAFCLTLKSTIVCCQQQMNGHSANNIME